MAQRVKRLADSVLTASWYPAGSAPVSIPLEFVWEWVPEEPTEIWTEWRVAERTPDQNPTFVPEYEPGLHLVPKVSRVHAVTYVTVVEERRLVRRWVDREQGQMAQTVRTEQRQRRY